MFEDNIYPNNCLINIKFDFIFLLFKDCNYIIMNYEIIEIINLFVYKKNHERNLLFIKYILSAFLCRIIIDYFFYFIFRNLAIGIISIF